MPQRAPHGRWHTADVTLLPKRKPRVSSATSDKFDWRGRVWRTELKFLAQRLRTGSSPDGHMAQTKILRQQTWSCARLPVGLRVKMAFIIYRQGKDTQPDLSSLGCAGLLEHEAWSKRRGSCLSSISSSYLFSSCFFLCLFPYLPTDYFYICLLTLPSAPPLSFPPFRSRSYHTCSNLACITVTVCILCGCACVQLSHNPQQQKAVKDLRHSTEFCLIWFDLFYFSVCVNGLFTTWISLFNGPVKCLWVFWKAL